MPTHPAAGWTQVLEDRDGRRVRHQVLVLEAMRIPCRVETEGERVRLLVPDAYAAMAAHQLVRYRAESEGWPPVESSDETTLPVLAGVRTIVAGAALLLLLFSFSERHSLLVDWRRAGSADAAAIRSGEWWRTITALTLHADEMHLLGNLVFGSLFAALLIPLLGPGLTAWSVLVTGVLGNTCNAWIQPETHRSLGASTAIFGAIGILSGYQWLRRRRRPAWFQRVAPVCLGAVFVGFLGTSGENTDVMAHCLGFLAGLLVGVGAAGWDPERLLHRRVQLLGGALTVGVGAAAWTLALLRAAGR